MSEPFSLRVLVVDDCQITLRVIRKALEQTGCTVETALDGAEALVRLSEACFDGVVADGVMPLVDGYELCRLIKEDSSTQDMPVILYTGNPDPVNRLWARICGADLFLPKGPDLAPLVHAVRQWPGHRCPAVPTPLATQEPRHIQTRLAQQLQRRLLESALRSAVSNLYEFVREPVEAAWALGQVLEELVLEGALFVVLPLSRGHRGLLMSTHQIPGGLLEQHLPHLFEGDIPISWMQRAGAATPLVSSDLDHHFFLLSDPGSTAFGWWGVLAPRDILEVYLPLFNAADEEFQRVYRTMMLLEQLGEANAELRAADQAKTDFVRTVSHEIRNPLTAAQAALELLDGGSVDPGSPRGARLVRTARRSVRRLLNLATGILDMEKIEAGEFRRDQVSIDLPALIQEVLEEYLPLAQERGISLDFPNRAHHPHALGDPGGLAQCLGNLVANALQHSPEGSQISLELQQITQGLRVSVRDQGSGVPPEFRQRLFRKFQQSDPLGRRGTGLGLAITRTLMEEMGGQVGYQDHPEGGADFFLTLPTAPAEVPASK